MRSRPATALVVAVLAAVVAGCTATAIGGSPEPNAAAVSGPATAPASAASPTVESSTAGSPEPEDSSVAPQPPSSDTGGDQPPGSVPSSSGAPSSAPPDSGGTGSGYPTTPLPYPKTPQSAATANLLEGRRIASYLVVPTFVAPSYTQGSVFTIPFVGPSALSVLFGSPTISAVAQRAGMITGFASARSDGAQNSLVVEALEFPSSAAATRAVPALSLAVKDTTTDKGKAVVPGYPAASGWYGSAANTGPYFQSFLAQGQMVLYVYVSGKKLATAAEQGALAAKALKAETASVAHFVPTPPDRLMSLPVDPEGMLAHTLPNTGANATVADGLMTAAGQLHYDTDPIGTKALFAKAGVDSVADGRVSLYRAANATGAALVRDDFIASVEKTTPGTQPFALTVAIPGIRCVQQQANLNYYCVGVRGRYAFEISSGSDADLEAAANAEYRLLQGF